jgi:hypothetical protein
MKKIILSIAAILTFSIASAQIDKDQPQQTQPDPVNGVEPDTKNKADQSVDVPIDPQTLEEQKSQNHDPMKDELKTEDHMKSTPDPSIVKDKTKEDSKKATDRNKKKKRRN